MVLAFVLLGGLIIAPFLGFMNTGHRTGIMFEDRTRQLYAADAGIEDGKWHIRYDHLDDRLPGYELYDYHGEWSYNLTEGDGGQVNGYDVAVNISNVWMPKGIDVPDPATAKQIVEDGTLVITGGLSGSQEYEIRIRWECGDGPVEAVGIWLPPGFEYNGDCSLEGESYYSEPDVEPHKGGYAVVWSFSDTVSLSGLPDSFTFKYSGPENQAPGAAISWIVTDADFAWDADTRIYRIVSVAGDTEVEAYVPRSELRQLGSAIAGNYFATGNSLIGGNYMPPHNYHHDLYRSTSRTITTGTDASSGIPEGASVQAAYLYWTGWIDWNTYGDDAEPGLKHPDDATPEQRRLLVEEAARVHRVLFNETPVTADAYQTLYPEAFKVVKNNEPSNFVGTWFYTAVADVTGLLRQWVANEHIAANGAGQYTLGHYYVGTDPAADDYRVNAYDASYSFDFHDTAGFTGYPLGTPAPAPDFSHSGNERYTAAHAGWSLLIIYSSPETLGHQLYLYDIRNPSYDFFFGWHSNADFDNDDIPGGTISGFLVPNPVGDEVLAGRITVMVGEGDRGYSGDSFKVNGEALNDGSVYGVNNVWNGVSPGMTVEGLDIDTFEVSWASGILNPGDTSVQVDVPTFPPEGSDISDGFTMVYMILSFRSEITTGGSLGYLIK